jgi:hypothetical protein
MSPALKAPGLFDENYPGQDLEWKRWLEKHAEAIQEGRMNDKTSTGSPGDDPREVLALRMAWAMATTAYRMRLCALSGHPDARWRDGRRSCPCGRRWPG